MNKVFPTKEELEKMYIIENIPMYKIAKISNVSVGWVFNQLHKYQIPTQPAHKGMFGKHQSEEVKDRISRFHKGKTVTLSTRIKISNAHKGLLRNPSHYGGHIKKHKSGYLLVYLPQHPYATKDGYVFEHILAYERAHNCVVDRSRFVVHHINEIKTDNSPENLVLMTASEHMSFHLTKRHKIERERRIING